MKILTWNCNGIRARFPLIKKIIESEKPDLLFLQETKIEDKIFPEKDGLISEEKFASCISIISKK